MESVLVSTLMVPVLLAPQGREVVSPTLRVSTVVVLLKDGCPCARECRFALNALADACRGKVRFVGLVDGDAAHAKALAKDAELRFPVLPDPSGSAIRALRGREGLDLRLLGTEGNVLGRWDGLDRANVAALAALIQARKGIRIQIDEGPFTTLPKLGCAFGLTT